jgi:Icc protein
MPVRLFQITDLHLFADPVAELRGVCPRARFEHILAALKSERAGADRLIITGDLTHDDRRETYVALRELLAGWLDILRVIPGNHDERTAMRNVFGDRVQVAAGRNVFAEEIGGWQLIGLDTHLDGSVAGRAGNEQLDWLEEQLQAADDRPTLLCLHHPPVSIGSRWLDEVGLEDAAELSAILARHPHVRLVCCGHVHKELAIGGGRRTVLATPATAVQFRPGTETLEIDDALPGYRVIELQHDGAWRSRVVRVTVNGTR